ncbi:MAG: dihydroxyacetone kinase phosphoryl donor subunit DhaM [Oscillospiraceae bacterium]|nr:dihydroxyacetone kinase phosphoryl donor subunit DhaM [Oscillospiraceae bacterium]
MVGIVIVSHSAKVAEGTSELAKMMAASAPVAYAGGLEDGSLGTSFELIEAAVKSVLSDDGVIMIMDMGSALMTAEMVIESFPDSDIRLADCPIVEGAVNAAVLSMCEQSIDEIMSALLEPDAFKKLV